MQQVKYAEVYYREYCDVLTKNFRWNLENELFIDVIFICKNGTKVPAHQVVLGSFSSFLYKLFSDHQQYFRGHVAYVCVPDIRSSGMRNVLKFIYYGKVILKNKKELSQLYEDLVFLDLPSNVISSNDEPFCAYISGMTNVVTVAKQSDELCAISAESNSILNVAGVISSGDFEIRRDDNVTNEMSNSVSSSSTFPVIRNVMSLAPKTNVTTTYGKSIEKCTNIVETHSTVDVNEKITLTEVFSRIEPCTGAANVVESSKTNSMVTSSNEESSTKKKHHLLAVLKNVAVVSQNLESVGVSDDESAKANLQSCVRIVKQSIVDINDLLSTEVTVSSHGNCKYIDVEKDWELKVMLDNCLETLPRLERAIENSTNRNKRHKRREKNEQIERVEHYKQNCSENGIAK